MEKAKKIKSLEGIQRVRFNDFSEYESEKSANGGAYGFWTTPVWKTGCGRFPTEPPQNLTSARCAEASMITVSKTELTSAVSSRRSAKRN